MRSLINFLTGRYLRSSLMYALMIGTTVTIRISLVLIMLMFFNSNDSAGFAVYAGFTVLAELAAFLGFYINRYFFSARLSIIIGILLSFSGLLIIYLSLTNLSKKFLYAGLSMVCISTGILKSNILSFSNKYLNEEVSSQNKAEYSSVTYCLAVLIAFIISFFTGAFLKENPQFIVHLNLSMLLLLSILFFINEWRDAFAEIAGLIYNWRESIKKLFFFLFFLGLVFVSVFIAFQYCESVFMKISILSAIICMYIYMFYLYKNTDFTERHFIYELMHFGLIYALYTAFERQRDMSFTLFLFRNVDYQLLNLRLNPVQINSFFPLLMLFASIICFKFKLFSKITIQKAFYICFGSIVVAFALLYIGCARTSAGMINFWYYAFIIPLFSIANTIFNVKFLEICSLASEKLRHITSAFMIMNLGFGFYLARLMSDLVAIDKSLTDPMITLPIYQNGFLKMLFMILAVVFGRVILLSFRRNKI